MLPNVEQQGGQAKPLAPRISPNHLIGAVNFFMGSVVVGLLLLFMSAALQIRISDVSVLLTLACGGAALLTVGYAAMREHIVQVRVVRQLRDPKRKDKLVAALRRRVLAGLQRQDRAAVEDAVRDGIESLILADCWEEVPWFVGSARQIGVRQVFHRWLMGVAALAALHENDPGAAGDALASIVVDGPWLVSIDALRLALLGEGQAALDRLGDPPQRPTKAVVHQRWLARVHGLAAAGRRDEARAALAERTGHLEAVLHPEGPATSLAVGLIQGGDGPFRVVH